jgi:GNAT superfamily N-acetyltransferase
MNNIIIKKAEENDIDEILKISKKNTITNIEDPSSGFLVSGYTKQQYLEYVGYADYFYVAKIDNKVVGVLLAFNDDKIKQSELVNSIIKNSVKHNFVLIKQIFVDPEFKGKKISAKLYNFLFETAPKDFDFAASIVGKPFNIASVKFHKKLGFNKLMSITPDADFDGEVRHRDIWYKKASEHRDIPLEEIMRVQVPHDEATVDRLCSNLGYAMGLYMHEDNLNWTKLGMLVTFVFALSAGFHAFYEQDSSISTLMSFLVIVLGFLITNLFSKKISSGIEYMGSHKNNVKIIERKLKYFEPNYERLIEVKNKNIANQSKTLNIMYKVPLVSYILFATLFIVWLVKFIS